MLQIKLVVFFFSYCVLKQNYYHFQTTFKISSCKAHWKVYYTGKREKKVRLTPTEIPRKWLNQVFQETSNKEQMLCWW